MITCPICSNNTQIIGKIDLNRSCLDKDKKRIIVKSNINVEYVECTKCGFIHSPEMCAWSKNKFIKLIYNKEYYKVDPDGKKSRPELNAIYLYNKFKNIPISHLDYGGGNGYVSKILRNKGLNSKSYDPFYDKKFPITSFDLITAFEVFEHHPNPNELANDLNKLSGTKSVIIFTTAVSDEIANPIGWGYVAPRNGHVCIYTKISLGILLNKINFKLFEITKDVAYVAYNDKPKWFNSIFN